MTVQLSKDVEAALALEARAAKLPTEIYLAQVVERAVENRRRRAAVELAGHLDKMAAQMPAETTAEQMEAAFEEALISARPERLW